MLFVVFPLYIVVREQNFDSPLATVPLNFTDSVSFSVGYLLLKRFRLQVRVYEI